MNAPLRHPLSATRPVPTLEARAIAGEGLDVLRALRKAQLSLLSAVPLAAVQQRLSGSALPHGSTWNALERLHNAGLIEARRAYTAASPPLWALTETGWAMVGGKPIWMED